MSLTEWLVTGDTLLTMGGVWIAVDAWRTAARALIVADNAAKLAYSKIDPRDAAIATDAA